MPSRSWIRELFARPVTRTIRKAPPRVRLAAEELETRWVPSIVVNNPTDTPVAGQIDLRQAIAQANTGGDQTITFDPGVFATPQTITLDPALGQLELSDTTGTETIMGPAAGATVSGNNASRVFQVDALVTASISGLTISGGNVGYFGTGGGLTNYGTTALTNCTVSGSSAGFGGGVFNYSGSLNLTNCTLSGNLATFGGGGVAAFGYGGTAALTNCTLSGNSAGYGGGLYTRSGGAAALTDCTVSGNSGFAFQQVGGLYSGFNGTITLGNTIVAGNTPSDVGTFFGGFISQGHNLIGATGGTPGFVGSDLTGTSAQPLNPVLAPLSSSYGGPTETMALLPGSPAIDAGASAGAPTTDQRGLGRVGAVDIGAFESQGFHGLALVSGTPQTAAIGTQFAQPLAVAVTANNPAEPVDGGVVTFVAQRAADGATAILPGATAVIAGGRAAVTAAPNNTDGSYTVTASVSGLAPATFALRNTGPVFASLAVNTTSTALFSGAGVLSLPEAVLFANADSVGNANITFDKTVFAAPQTITLTGTQLELSNTGEAETITGPKAGVTVSGGGLSRVFQVDAGVTASFSGLTLGGGKTNGNGGGLLNSGTATLTGCTISGNSAASGGGVFNSGTAALTNCTVSGNSASGFGGDGGGVFNSGTATLTGCTISGNSGPHYGHGAGLFNSGKAALTNSTVSGNSAPYGGGLWNNGAITLGSSTVSGNSSNFGGALDNFGAATFTNCTISRNSAGVNGGGLDNLLFATAALTNCTISGNSTAGSGGGLFNYYFATATLTNCTVSGNSANFGGGLNNGFLGTMTVTGSNIKGNTAVVGGGIANQGTLNVASSNIINNTATSRGGGLSTTGGSATLANCVINTNQVINPTGTALGGGIDCENSTLALTNCAVNANQANGATAEGGGIYAFDSTVTVTNSTVNGNKANGSVLGEGGGIYSSHSPLTLVASTVKGNKASTDSDDLFNGP
jgi:hypothetical protein